jgi:hypothetical protein
MSDTLNVSFGGGEPVVPDLASAPENWLAALSVLNFYNVFGEADSQVSNLGPLTVDTCFGSFPLEEFNDPREHLPDIEDLDVGVLNTAMDNGSDIEDIEDNEYENLSVMSLNYELVVDEPSS